MHTRLLAMEQWRSGAQLIRRKRRVNLYAIEFFGDAPVNLLEFNDIALTYELKGAGERVVRVHASPFVSWYTPLIERLTGFSTLLYRRDLRKTDAGTYRRLTVAEDAAICVRLMAHVGWERAHVVGHSYGALVALQTVTSTAERVGTLSRLEPAIRGIPSSAAVLRALVPVITTYKLGDTAGAVDAFLRLVCGDRYRVVLDRVIPNAFSEALAYADLFFQRRCRRSPNGASDPPTRLMSRDPFSTCSAPRARNDSWKAANSCSPGFRKRKNSRCPRQGTSSWCRTQPQWPTV